MDILIAILFLLLSPVALLLIIICLLWALAVFTVAALAEVLVSPFRMVGNILGKNKKDEPEEIDG